METPTPPPSTTPVPGADGFHLREESDAEPIPAGHEKLVDKVDHADVEQEPLSVTPNGLHFASDLVPDQERPSSSSMARTVPVTRTVAIIKNHALQHRFDIEPRIQEASFEIVKERQMEFDVETDPDALYDLFGEDADSLAEGPVWVYVLERKRAVEVWNTLMGDRDPEVARVEAPNSLRALYGISRQQNALMGSPDTQTAEIQISALFASSPPFRTTDLPSEGGHDRYGSIRSLSSSVLEALQAEQSETGYAPSTNPSTVNGSNKSNGKPSFKARPVPVTNVQPDIMPRMSRAAALRITGTSVDRTPPSKPREPLSKERLAQTFANVPGHKRTETIAVASVAPPAIAPRMTKAASLRIAKEAAAANGAKPVAPAINKRSVTDGAVSAAEKTEKAKATFEGVPGHKRRETISVASVKPPTVAPRLNKSAALRQSKEGGTAPPTSFRGSAPGISRTNSADSGSSRRQSAPLSRTPSQAPSPARTPARRASSVLSVRSPMSNPSLSEADVSAGANGGATEAGRPSSVAAKPRPRPSSVVSPPSIAPRTNKSAALRAAKMEAEAAAAAAKKAPRASKPPPSSFKPNTIAT